MIREDIIREHVTGKDVLDVGSTGQTDKYSLWDIIEKNARSLAGIDLTTSDRKNVVQGNMETYSFGKKFDVIVLGDVIEHVDNQGTLLDNLYRHLKEDGELIITTPNAKWLTVLLRPNTSHSLWHDRYTLEVILKRHGFSVSRLVYYCGNKNYYNPVVRLFLLRQQMLCICNIAKRG